MEPSLIHILKNCSAVHGNKSCKKGIINLTDVLLKSQTHARIQEKDVRTLYIPTRTSSLINGWSFPVLGTTSPGIFACFLPPLTELLCARNADSALSYMSVKAYQMSISLFVLICRRKSVELGPQQRQRRCYFWSITRWQITQILLYWNILAS